MNFPHALQECFNGKKITNENWNGKGQYAFMMKGYTSIPANQALSNSAGIPVGENVSVAPYLMLKNAQGVFVNWVPSIGDIFSEGWKVIEDDVTVTIKQAPNFTSDNQVVISYEEFSDFLKTMTHLGGGRIELRKQIKLVE